MTQWTMVLVLAANNGPLAGGFVAKRQDKGNAAGSNNDDWNSGFGQKYGPLEILHSLCVDGHCVDGGDAEECWAADVVGAREGGEKGAASAADYWTSGRAKGCEVRLLAFQGACFLEMEYIGKMELLVCCLFFSLVAMLGVYGPGRTGTWHVLLIRGM